MIGMWWKITDDENEKEITAECVRAVASAIFGGQITYVLPSSRIECYTEANVKADKIRIIESADNHELLELEKAIGFVHKYSKSNNTAEMNPENKTITLYLLKE